MVLFSQLTVIVISQILVCLFGFVSNGLALWLLIRLPGLKNSFGYMCTSHILAGLFSLILFLVWVVPMTITKNEEASLSNLGKAIAGICILFWEVSNYSHLFISFNRFCAIYFPIYYMNIFNKKITFTFIAMSWIMGIAHVSPFLFDGCGIHYHPDTYVWLYDDTACSQWIAKWLDYYLNSFYMSVIGLLDILNVIRIVKMRKSLKMTSVIDQRKRRESLFFGQAFCQNILFFFANLFFFESANWVSNPIIIYFFTTFYWGFIHTADGFMLFMFNIGMRQKKKTVVALVTSDWAKK